MLSPARHRAQEFGCEPLQNEARLPGRKRRLESAHQQHALNRRRRKTRLLRERGIEMDRIGIAGDLRITGKTRHVERPECLRRQLIASFRKRGRQLCERGGHAASPFGKGTIRKIISMLSAGASPDTPTSARRTIRDGSVCRCIFTVIA